MAVQPLRIPLFKVFIPADAHTRLAPVLVSGTLAEGPMTAHFRAAISDYLGNQHVLPVSDISAAITLALFASGVRPGDDVVVSPMSCLATTTPIANLFARAAWCDVDPLTGMPDATMVAAALTPKTKAVLLYHWSGDVAAFEPIHALARDRGIASVDDISEALGAECNGRHLGNHGADFSALSFGPVRQVTCGEGGAIAFGSETLFEAVRWLKYYGIHRPSFRLANGDLNPDSDIPVAGFHFGLGEMAATIGLSGMGQSAFVTSRYKQNGQWYDEALKGIPGITLLNRRKDSVSGYWTYNLRAERRDDLMHKLHDAGIGCQRLHLRNDSYSCFGGRRDDLPGVDLFDAENLSLPCGWWVGQEERDFITATIKSGW